MPTARRYLRVAAASNGKLYAIGGHNGSAYLATVEEYAPATNPWTPQYPMNYARANLGVATAPFTGQIYAIGGTDGSFLRLVEAFLPSGGAPPPTATSTPTRTATATATATPARTSTPTATPYPQPDVGVGAGPNPSTRTLHSTITARDAGCAQGNNQLVALRFTRLANATVDVPGAGTVSGAQPVALPSRPAAVTLTIRRVTEGQPTTVEVVVTDGCGEWPTFIGGGPSAGLASCQDAQAWAIPLSASQYTGHGGIS
jgi:hypothetical protein